MRTENEILRDLAISLMANNESINEKSYGYLRELLEREGHQDIIDAVEATDNYFYLPESFDD